MGNDYESYKTYKKSHRQPHDKLFIQGIWTYAGWIDRIGMISACLVLVYIGARGWLN